MGEEKLKGFFHLHLNQLSTIQEIIEGDKKKRKKGDGILESKRGREEGKEDERKGREG